MYLQQQVGAKHYCDKSDCSTPSNLTGARFCTNCCEKVRLHPTRELQSEFVAITQKQLRERERLPLHFRQQLCYGYPPDSKQNLTGNYRQISPSPWQSISDYQQKYAPRIYWDSRSNSVPLENDAGQVLGYYRYVLVSQPSDSGKAGKLFWLMVIGAVVAIGIKYNLRSSTAWKSNLKNRIFH